MSSEADLRAFLAFPYQIYADDPGWSPPLTLLRRRGLSAKTNPFLREATLALFLARRGEQVVGTISALRDPRHERVRGEKAAFFGFFECIDDPEVAAALLGAAAGQARAWGAEILRGPRNLSRIEEVGALVEGFDTPQPMLAGHSRPWYGPLLDGLGLTKHHDVLAYDIDTFLPDGGPRPFPERVRRKFEAVDIDGLEIHPVRWRHINEDLELAHTLFVDAFREVPENTPMPRDQFLAVGRLFLLFADRRMISLATVGGQPAGFCVSFPELNQVLGRARGRLLPLGWARAAAAWPHKRTASFKLIGVMPPWRGTGLNMLLIRHAVDGVRAAGYRRVEASLIDERNERSRGTVESIGMKVYRRYRLYDYAL